MNTCEKILVVDDDNEIRELLGEFLKQHSYEVLLAANGDEMQQHLDAHRVDLIILDIMMPGDDGLTLCRKLRASSSIPILMLTAVSQDIDRIVGLEMGADDYISKPFNPRELLARIKAVLRRTQGMQAAQSVLEKTTTTHTILHFSNWQLDQTSRRLYSPDNIEISLSSGEFDLLLTLLKHPQQVLSRDQLLDFTKNREAGPFDRSIDIQISRLRHKIEENPKKPQLIQTVRGGGYVLASTVQREQKAV